MTKEEWKEVRKNVGYRKKAKIFTSHCPSPADTVAFSGSATKIGQT